MFIKLGDRLINFDMISTIDLREAEAVHLTVAHPGFSGPNAYNTEQLLSLRGEQAAAFRKFLKAAKTRGIEVVELAAEKGK